ncbi:hypothetical protein GCM10009532_14390 [Microbacterium aurantiacum]
MSPSAVPGEEDAQATADAAVSATTATVPSPRVSIRVLCISISFDSCKLDNWSVQFGLYAPHPPFVNRLLHDLALIEAADGQLA